MSHSRAELRRAAIAIILGVAAGRSASARADTLEVRAKLTYELAPGAEACPAERSIHEQVALRLGYDPFHDDAHEHVTVRIAPRAGGLHAVVTTEQPGEAPASRELDSEGSGCDELVRSLVLTVSLAIDPMSLTRAPRTAGPPKPPAQPPLAPAPAPTLAPVRERTPWNVELSASVRGGYALLPGGGSIGPLIDLRVGKPGWALLAELGADLPTGSAPTPKGTGTVSASLLRGGLGACALPGWFVVCAQVDAGELEGTGQGSATNVGLDSASFYLDASAVAGASLRLTSAVRLEILADLVVPITRTTLKFNDEPTAWSSTALAGLLSAGVGYRF